MRMPRTRPYVLVLLGNLQMLLWSQPCMWTTRSPTHFIVPETLSTTLKMLASRNQDDNGTTYPGLWRWSNFLLNKWGNFNMGWLISEIDRHIHPPGLLSLFWACREGQSENDQWIDQMELMLYLQCLRSTQAILPPLCHGGVFQGRWSLHNSPLYARRACVWSMPW